MKNMMKTTTGMRFQDLTIRSSMLVRKNSQDLSPKDDEKEKETNSKVPGRKSSFLLPSAYSSFP